MKRSVVPRALYKRSVALAAAETAAGSATEELLEHRPEAFNRPGQNRNRIFL